MAGTQTVRSWRCSKDLVPKAFPRQVVKGVLSNEKSQSDGLSVTVATRWGCYDAGLVFETAHAVVLGYAYLTIVLKSMK